MCKGDDLPLDGFAQRAMRGALEGQGAGERLVQDDPQGPDVHGGPVILLACGAGAGMCM